MPIIGFNFTKTSIERKRVMTRAEKISNFLKIKDVKKEQLPAGAILKVSFEFQVKYGESGEAVLEGEAIYTDKEGTLDNIVKEHSTSNQLPKNVRELIINSIFYKCNIKTLMLAESVGLPPHFQTPSVKAK